MSRTYRDHLDTLSDDAVEFLDDALAWSQEEIRQYHDGYAEEYEKNETLLCEVA